MQVILGASGQVGSAIVHNLLAREESVRAVVRDEKKGKALREAGAEVVIADATDLSSLQLALEGAESLFVLTPESDPKSAVLEKTQQIVDNYRLAIDGSSLQRVIALSSMGAQFGSGTGNLLMSNILERGLSHIAVPHAFVRPAYFFSNWMTGLKPAQQQQVLPTFFPAGFKLTMISPSDVAAFCSYLLTSETGHGTIYALDGPAELSNEDVAEAFSEVLGTPIAPQVIPRGQWEATLQKTGLSADGVKYFVEMTEAVVSGKAAKKDPAAKPEKAKTTIAEFLREALAEKEAHADVLAG